MILEETDITTKKINFPMGMVLQNSPIPLGNAKTTLTQNYDKERFYIPSRELYEDLYIYSTFFVAMKSLSASYKDFYQMFVQKANSTLAFKYNNISNVAIGGNLIQKGLYSNEYYKMSIFNTLFSIELIEFCQQKGLFIYLQNAIELIDSIFSSIQTIDFRIQQDPEYENEWLVIDIDVYNSIDDFLKEYDEYIDKIVKKIPYPKRSQIRLAYNLV